MTLTKKIKISHRRDRKYDQDRQADEYRLLGESMKAARLKRLFSIKELAERARVDRSTIYHIEHGKPTISLFSFLNVLKVLDLGMYKSTSDLQEITNRISDLGAEYVCKLVEENTVLEYLSITQNGIEIEGITKIIDAVQNNNSLIQFEIQQYGLVLPQELVKKFKIKLEENRINKAISDVGKYVRVLKHTEKIINIDSIYRNNSK